MFLQLDNILYYSILSCNNLNIIFIEWRTPFFSFGKLKIILHSNIPSAHLTIASLFSYFLLQLIFCFYCSTIWLSIDLSPLTQMILAVSFFSLIFYPTHNNCIIHPHPYTNLTSRDQALLIPPWPCTRIIYSHNKYQFFFFNQPWSFVLIKDIYI